MYRVQFQLQYLVQHAGFMKLLMHFTMTRILVLTLTMRAFKAFSICAAHPSFNQVLITAICTVSAKNVSSQWNT